jgi:hypothetical protein
MDLSAIAKLQQFLVGMLPRGWRSVELTVERGDGFARVVNVSLQAVAPAKPPPFLGYDQSDSISAINDVLAALPWSGPRARVARDEVVLFADDGSEQHKLTLAPSLLAELIVSDALFDAIDRAHAELDDKQRAFDDRIRGFRNWGFDQQSGRMAFELADGTPLEGHGAIVGSWNQADETWMWAWANPSVSSNIETDSIRDFGEVAALRTPSFAARLPLASQLAFIAGARLGADGVFGGRHGAGVVFIAAMP